MPPKRKYQLLVAGVVFLFVYVTGTEVVDRWRDTYAQYLDFAQKQKEVLEPAILAEKKLELLARRDSLTGLLTEDGGDYDQSQTGVFEFLAGTARTTNVHMESVVPVSVQKEGQVENIGFRLALSAGFHDVGFYLNALEGGAMSVRISKLELSNGGKVLLHADLEGVASVFPRKKP